MSWRFRRTIRLAPGVRLNLSKRGMGVSVGRRGLHVGIGPRGPYVSGGLPGTGLYDIEYLGRERPAPRQPDATGAPAAAASGGCCGCLVGPALTTGLVLAARWLLSIR